MTGLSQKWAFLDRVAAVHDIRCESLAFPDEEIVPEDGPERTDDALTLYGGEARRIYDDLKRVIGHVGGLLILVQASTRREALDLVSLAHAEGACAQALDRIARLKTPGRSAVHRERLLKAGRLVEATLVALRDVPRVAGEIDLAPASNALKRAYALLQSTSESRFGMTMVDFRHACCTCGAIK